MSADDSGPVPFEAAAEGRGVAGASNAGSATVPPSRAPDLVVDEVAPPTLCGLPTIAVPASFDCRTCRGPTDHRALDATISGFSSLPLPTMTQRFACAKCCHRLFRRAERQGLNV